jgi:hypothetical protein
MSVILSPDQKVEKMESAKSLKELQMAFLGWKQCKKVFAVYFDKNVARELVKILNSEFRPTNQKE